MKSLLVLFLFGSGCAITLDEAYMRCKNVTREDLEPCLVQLINDLRPLIQKGIAQLGIKGNKINAETFSHDTREGPNNYVVISFDDMVIRGFRDFEMKYLKVDYDQKVAAWSVLFPKLQAVSQYIMDAKVLYFPLYGNGTAWLNADNYQMNGVSKLDVQKINGDWRLQETDTEMTFGYEKSELKFTNLCDENEAMEAAASQFLESNTDALVNLFRPGAKQVFRQFTGNMVNKVLSKILLEDLAGNQYLKEAFQL